MSTIRNAREDEADVLADIGLRAWEQAMTTVGETTEMLENARDAFRNFVRSSWLTITVIETHGTLAGWGAREALDENVTDFWIDPAHTRQGLGRELLAAIEQEIIHQGFDKVALETHARNDGAVRFFKAQGYTVHWLSMVYSPKLDRDVQSVGLSKQLVAEVPDTYGPMY